MSKMPQSLNLPADKIAYSVTWRSSLLGIGLTLLVAIFTPFNDYVVHNTYFIGNNLPMSAIFCILLLSLVVNPLLGPRRFRRGEMIVAFSMMLIASALPSSGLYRYLYSILADSVYQAGQNSSFIPFIHALPSWMLASKNPHSWVLRDFYLGFSDHSRHSYWDALQAWALPVVTWACFLLGMFGAIIFFCLIMRKQWVQRERLPYPLATIPLELLADPEPGRRINALWRSPLLWIAAAITFCIDLYNGSLLFPMFHNLPPIPTTYNLSKDFSQFPWNSIVGAIQRNSIYFSVVGVTFFIPLEISFSIWFFFLAYNFGYVFLVDSGSNANIYTMITWQSPGMYAAYFIITLWVVRRHIRDVFISTIRFLPREPDEFLPYWVSTWGFLLCVAIATAFLAFAGLNWWCGLLVVDLLLFYCMMLTRVIAEAGLLMVDFSSGPFHALQLLFSSNPSALSIRQWMVARLSMANLWTDQRENLMPFASDVLRMGSEVQPHRKVRYVTLLLGSLVLCFVVAGTVNMLLSYKYGASTFNGYSAVGFPYNTVESAIHAAQPNTASTSPLTHLLYVIEGAVAMTAVAGSRLLFADSPFHPIALLFLNSYAMDVFWFSVFIGWLLKAVILRWGGVELYKKARPFFFGLIIGESIAYVFWMFIGFFVGWPSGVQFWLLPG
ncbi:MAG: hypothetical protein HKL95_05370 [Phycisphaerae bacterium]|nr:hypothetical protein [Phycisphaerae bacterium]